MAWALGNLDIGIILFEAIAHFLDVFHREAEMIEPRAYTGLALQERETDDAVAQMTAILVVVALLIGHAVGNLLHAKDGLVELRFPIPILGHHRDMSNGREHDLLLLLSRILVKVDGTCQPTANWFEFRLSSLGSKREPSIRHHSPQVT